MPSRHSKIPSICLHCEKEFLVHAYRKLKGYGNYCSLSCSATAANLNKRKPLIDRFLASVEKTESCWIWTGAKRGRYGVMLDCETGKNIQATHVSYMLAHGRDSISEGLWVLHDCPGGDNPSCVNPGHLWLGTNIDNVNDCVSKRRHSFGENVPTSKLTYDKVIEIRRLAKTGISGVVLGEMFDVTANNIYLIISRKTWKHLP